MAKNLNDYYDVNPYVLKLYHASKEARHILNEENRLLKAERNWNARNPGSLVIIALRVIAANYVDFAEYFSSHSESKKYLKTLLTILPTDLPLAVSSKTLPDGIFWKRSCYNTWSMANFLMQFKYSWKNLYMEKYLQDFIENAHPNTINLVILKELIDLVKEYVETLRIEQLQVIDIHGSQVDEIKHIDLRFILSPLINLQDLAIRLGVKNCGIKFSRSHFNLTNVDSVNIGAGLKKMIKLEKFKITTCSLNENKLRPILNSLVLLPLLQYLDFSFCNITDEEIMVLSSFLSSMRSLKELILVNNQIGSDGAVQLASVLTECCSLHHLNLRLNFIKDEGAKKLLTAVSTHSSLEKLNLAACKLTGKCADSLSHLIRINRKLKNLDLNCNNLAEATGTTIVQALQMNNTIQKLNIKMNHILSEDMKIIEEKLSTNKNEI